LICNYAGTLPESSTRAGCVPVFLLFFNNTDNIVRVHIAILALALVAFLSACGTSPEQKAACDELAEMACDFTPDEFLDAAEYGDTLNRIKLED